MRTIPVGLAMMLSVGLCSAQSSQPKIEIVTPQKTCAIPLLNAKVPEKTDAMPTARPLPDIDKKIFVAPPAPACKTATAVLPNFLQLLKPTITDVSPMDAPKQETPASPAPTNPAPAQ